VTPGQNIFGHHLPDAEIGQFDLKNSRMGTADDDVGGLDVAMNDARLVRRLQRIGHLGHDLQARRQQHLVQSALFLPPICLNPPRWRNPS
jgi:hypothetical protein